MKTERLYYDNPYLLEFDAQVVGTRTVGAHVEATLDKTAFYPTSGGQPNDLGAIDGVPVIDCYEEESTETIVHVLDGSVNKGPVHCRIDGKRRSDHMQQHSGQHVLSQAFVDLFNWPTLSFHLGVTTCTIDLPADTITPEQAERAEELANRVIRENRSVAVRYVAQENIAETGLRKPTDRTGEIRVIDIAGYDRSACGGTHVRTTGEIGGILITGLERAKKQTRVQFICGDRVIYYGRSANRTLETISQTISAPPLETAGAVRNLWDEHQQLRKRVEELESQLIEYEAAGFPVDNGFAIGSFNGRGIDTLKMLAVKICARAETVALLADQSDQLRVVFARSADSIVDVAAVLKHVLAQFGGRGGGRPNLAQGGGLTGNTEEILQFAKITCGGGL